MKYLAPAKPPRPFPVAALLSAIALAALGPGIVFGQAQLTIDFTYQGAPGASLAAPVTNSGVIQVPSTAWTSNGQYVVDVWAVVTDPGVADANLGLQFAWSNAVSSVGGTGKAFTGGGVAGGYLLNDNAGPYAAGTDNNDIEVNGAPTSPWSGTGSQSGFIEGPDANGYYDVGDNTTQNDSTNAIMTGYKGTTPNKKTILLGNTSGTDGGGGVAYTNTAGGSSTVGGWAFFLGTYTYQVGTATGTSGSQTIFSPQVPTWAAATNAYSVTGENPTTFQSNYVAGTSIEFEGPMTSSPTPGLSLGTGTPPTRQIIGSLGAITLSGNVTNTGSGAYDYTGFTDNSTGGGALTSFSPSSGTVAATSGSNPYTVTGAIANGTTPGTTVAYQATVTDGTNTAQNSPAVDVTAVVSRAGSTGFSIGTANLGSAVYANGPGTFGAPTLSGTAVINGGSLGNNAATNLTIGSGSFGTLTATQTGGVANGQLNAASQSGTWTVSGAAPTMSQITGTSLIAANNVVNGTISMSTTGEGLAGEVTTVSIPYTYSTVGNAAADISGNGTFGGAAATASIGSDGGSFANGYAGLAAQAAGAFTGNGTGGAGLEHSVAEILMGSNSGSFTGNQAASVGILMRNRMLSEAPGNDSVPTQNAGFPNGTPTTALPLISDVARLYGLNSSAIATASGLFPTDPFAFEMSFNPGTLNAEGAFGNAMASRGNLYLASIMGGTWQNTIVGDFATGADDTGTYKGGTIQIGSAASTAMNGNFNVPLLESFATFEANDDVNAGNLGTFIGVWGVDTTNDEAWAVINHDSDFAVVPEPSAIILALFGLLGGALALRRKKTLAAA